MSRGTQSGTWPIAFLASSSVAALTAVARRRDERRNIFY